MMYEIPEETKDFLRKLFRNLIENSKRLLGDAVTLFEGGSFPSAQFLAMTAMEEMAKLQDIRRPFLAIRSKEGLDEALDHLEKRLSGLRERQETSFRAAPYMVVEDPKEWAHIVDMVSRMVRSWGREELLRKRLASLVVDAHAAGRTVSVPAEEVRREDAYYFICAAHEMIADYGDKGLDPFPLDGGSNVFEAFDLWQWADRSHKEFMKKHAVK